MAWLTGSGDGFVKTKNEPASVNVATPRKPPAYAQVLVLAGFFSFAIFAEWVGWQFLDFIPRSLAQLVVVVSLAYLIVAYLNSLYRRLAASESLFRMLTEEIKEAVWRQDKNNIVTYISPADQRMRGFRADEVIGRSVFEMLTEEGVVLAKDAAKLKRQALALPARHKDGKPLWIEITSTTELDAEGHVVGYHGVSRDVTQRVIAEAHEAFRSRILEMMAGSEDLNRILTSIVTGIESMHPEMLCSILRVDDEGKRLCNVIGPSLPEAYNRAVDGIEIGVGHGACGTAAFLGERVIVEDIATHPYWIPYRDLTLPAGLRACWSQPIRSSSHQILGTLAIYLRQPTRPGDAEIKLIEQSARLVSIAIERHRVDDALRESHLFSQSILDSVSSQIAVVNETGVIVSVNEAWRRFSLENGTEPGKMAPHTDIGTNYLEICSAGQAIGADGVDVRAGIRAVLEGELPSFGVEYPCHSMHEQRWFMMTVTPLRTGKRGAVIVHTNISERKRAESKIEKLAFYDPLTSLPNRRLLQDRLTQLIAASKRCGSYCAMIFLDLDNFKPLNDCYGHDLGDALLIEAAHRLQKCVRETDTVARFGGDEFVVMLGQLSPEKDCSLSQARQIAEKIQMALSVPYRLAGKNPAGEAQVIEHQCTVSIGVNLFNDRECDHEIILKRADVAMYQAKQAGRNSIRFAPHTPFSSSLGAAIPDRLIQLNWHSSYESGNAVIDGQHRKLFLATNQLLSTVLAEQSAADVLKLIERLLGEVSQHFRDEETILQAAKVSGWEDHAVAHRMLEETASRLTARYRAGSTGIGELFEFLAHEVVARHMLVKDREFFSGLQVQSAAHGVSGITEEGPL